MIYPQIIINQHMSNLNIIIDPYVETIKRWINILKSTDVETKITKISSIVADIVNCSIFIFLGLFYCLMANQSSLLIPLFGFSICMFLMVQSYIKNSILIYSIYHISSALFYLLVSIYVILYNLVLEDIPSHIVYALLFKMNIPTIIMGFAIVMNSMEIEREIKISDDSH